MAGTTATAADGEDESNADAPVPTGTRRAAIDRVRNLSIFFVGAGLLAVGGLALAQTGLLATYRTTYFSVGAALGVVGLLLWLLTR